MAHTIETAMKAYCPMSISAGEWKNCRACECMGWRWLLNPPDEDGDISIKLDWNGEELGYCGLAGPGQVQE